MDVQYRFKNIMENLARLSRGQKLVAGALALVVILTWLVVCVLLVSLFL
jgi:hypothetical protein